MEDSLELANYLPLSFKTPKEEEYIAFLCDEKGTSANGADSSQPGATPQVSKHDSPKG